MPRPHPAPASMALWWTVQRVPGQDRGDPRGRTGPASSRTLTVSTSLLGLPPPYLPYLYLLPAPLHLGRWSQMGRALLSCTPSPALTPPESHEHWAHYTPGNTHLGSATSHIWILLEEGPKC